MPPHPGGEEYVSFHYQNHKIPDAVPVNYVSNTPKTFDELYSPRLMGVRIIGKEVKDRFEYVMHEDRKNKLMVITVKDTEGEKEAMRSIFLDLKCLYEELHFKSIGNRDVLMKKEDKNFKDDAELDIACKAFIMDRLKRGKEWEEWPVLRDISDLAPPSSSAAAAGSDEEPHKERMAVFTELDGDEVFSNSLEVKCPRNYKGLGISMSSFRPKPLSKEAIKKKKEAAAAAAAAAAAEATTSAQDDDTDTLNTTAVEMDDTKKSETINEKCKADAGSTNSDNNTAAPTAPAAAAAAATSTSASTSSNKKASASTSTPNTSPSKKVAAAGSGASAVKAKAAIAKSKK